MCILGTLPEYQTVWCQSGPMDPNCSQTLSTDDKNAAYNTMQWKSWIVVEIAIHDNCSITQHGASKAYCLSKQCSIAAFILC